MLRTLWMIWTKTINRFLRRLTSVPLSLAAVLRPWRCIKCLRAAKISMRAYRLAMAKSGPSSWMAQDPLLFIHRSQRGRTMMAHRHSRTRPPQSVSWANYRISRESWSATRASTTAMSTAGLFWAKTRARMIMRWVPSRKKGSKQRLVIISWPILGRVLSDKIKKPARCSKIDDLKFYCSW